MEVGELAHTFPRSDRQQWFPNPYLSVIDVANGTNVNMGLRSLEDGICAVDVHKSSSILSLQSRLERANIAVLEAVASRAQKRRN